MSNSVTRATRRSGWFIVPLVLACFGTLPATAVAGSFQVNPIRVDLGKGATNAVIKVRNDGDEAVVIQASVLAWTQSNGQDTYTPTTEALITPPVMTVAPGAEQVVRVGLRRSPDPQRELAYRVFLQEVAPPPKPGFSGLQVSLRVGLPVFVAPVAPATRKLEWSARIAPNGTVMLTASNAGNAHVQVTDVELSAPSGGPVAHESSLVYVLAGQTHEWTLPAPPDRARGPGELRLKALTDAGDIDTAVKVEP